MLILDFFVPGSIDILAYRDMYRIVGVYHDTYRIVAYLYRYTPSSYIPG